MIKIIQGFDVGSPLPIDGRILLSKEEMKNIDDNIMPDRYFCICEDDDPDRGLLYLYDKYADTDEFTGKFHKAVPEKTSEIENDGNGELNSEGVADPFDTVESVNSKVQELRDYTDSEFVRVEEYTENNFVDNETFKDSLLGYRLTQNTSEGIIGTPIGSYIDFDYDTSDYAFSVVLKNFDGVKIAETETINLPVEQLVMDVDYVKNSEGSFIVITLDNGNQTWVDVDDIIEGLVNEITFNDHVDDVYDANTDTHNTSLHVLYEQGQAWDAKYDLPAQGIPRSDLRDSEDSEGVLRSLDLADSAIQPGDSLSLLSNDAGSEGYFITESYIEDNLFNGSEGYIHAGQNIIVEDDEYGKKISAHVHKFIPGQGIHFSDATGSDYEDVTEIWADATAPDWAAIDGNNPLENEALADVFDTKQDKLTAEGGIEIVETSEGSIIRSTSVEWGNIEGDISDQTDLVNYIDNNGGKIDSISVNGIEQSIDSSKNVDISMPIIGAVPQGSGEGVNVAITLPPHPVYRQNHTLASVLYVHSVVGSNSGPGTGNIINFTIDSTNGTVVCDRTISSIMTLLNKEYLNAIVKDDQDNIYTACRIYQDPNLSLIKDIRFFTFKSGTLREINILRDSYGEEPTTSVGIVTDYKVISSVNINDVHSNNGTLRLTAEDIPYWPDWFETSEEISIFDVVGGCVSADDVSAVTWSGSYNDLIDKPTIPSAGTGDSYPVMDGTRSLGSQEGFARVDHVHPTDTSRAPIASPEFTGTPTTPNLTSGSSNGQIANKKYVDDSISSAVTVAAATFKGVFNSSSNLGTANENDYAFVKSTDSGNEVWTRYEYHGSSWSEVSAYKIYNNQISTSQWNAMNSGATSAKISSIPTNASSVDNKLLGVKNVSFTGSSPITVNQSITTGNGGAAGEGVSVAVSHNTSNVTPGTYGQSSNASLIPGATISVPSVTVDDKGHVTAASNKTITNMQLNIGSGIYYDNGLDVHYAKISVLSSGNWVDAYKLEFDNNTGYWTENTSYPIGKRITIYSNTTAGAEDNINWINSSSHPVIDLAINDDVCTSVSEIKARIEDWNKIYRAMAGYNFVDGQMRPVDSTSNGVITFWAYEVPTYSHYVSVKG